jgi:hypothetical protein
MDAMATKLKRYRNEMLLIMVALGLVFAVTAGLIVSRVMRAERAASGSPPSGGSSAPVTRQLQPLPTPPAAAQALPGQPQQQPPETIVSEENNPASLPSTGSISPEDVQNAFTTLSKKEKQREPSPQQLPASSAVSSGSDRYPGSEPIEVNANLVLRERIPLQYPLSKVPQGGQPFGRYQHADVFPDRLTVPSLRRLTSCPCQTWPERIVLQSSS